MKKKNLLALFLFVLMSVCANRVQAQVWDIGVPVTADIQLDGMTYGEDYYVVDKATSGQIFQDSNTASIADGGVAGWGFYLFVRNKSIPEGKTIDDIEAIWNGEVLSSQKYGTTQRYFEVSIVYDGVFLESGTFSAKWKDTNAIEGVAADSKAVYYADGVVYNHAGEIAIYNLTGKLVLRSSDSLVDVSNLTGGVYVVRGGGKTVKFVK